jgi:hypothetical protein
MKRIAILGILLLALHLDAAAAASPRRPVADDTIPIGFSIVPGKPLLAGHVPANAPRYFTFLIAPGRAASDLVAVANPSTTTLTLQLSTSDAMTPPTGGGIAFNDSHRQRFVGQWLALSGPRTVTVPAGKIRIIPFTLKVPSSVRPGEYEGTINGTNTRAQIVHRGKRTLRIRGSVRCLVRLRVTGQAMLGLRITRTRAIRASNHTLFVVSLKNTGTVIDHASAPLLTFTSTGGSHPITLRPQPIGDILGGDSTTLPYIIDPAIVPGSYHVSIQVAYQASPDTNGQPVVRQVSWSGTVSIPNG